MTRSGIIERMADEMGVGKGIAEKGLDAMIASCVASLEDGQKVSLGGLGTLKIVRHKAMVGRNPRTGDQLEIPSRKVVKFRPNEKLKERVAAQ
jgi:DNA-binding protein HU-beta